MKQAPLVILGNITTMNEAHPSAEALCSINGKVARLGTRQEVLDYAGEGCSVIDLAGFSIYPGFIDSHSHLSGYSGMMGQVYCGSSNRSIAAILAKLSEAAASDEGKWVLGYGYDDTGMPENRHLTIDELDAACPSKPLLVRHISLHFAYINSLGLRELGFAPGARRGEGKVVTDSIGRPTGLLTEQIAFEAFARIPVPTASQTKARLAQAIDEYNACGFTSVIDGAMGVLGDAAALTEAYEALDRENRLHVRVHMQAVYPLMKRWMEQGLCGTGSSHLRYGGFKTFADGSIQCGTAALSSDYHSRPGWKGECIRSSEDMERDISFYNSQGIQVAVHCNGDAGIELALRAFEKAWAESPRPDLAHTIVHAQTASDGQLRRMKACGVIPTFFSSHIEVWGDRHRDIFLGPDRAARMNPAGSCVRLGMPFGLHVDTPVLPPTALGNMHNAVNRITSKGFLLGPEQRIQPMDAIKAYTTHAARCWHGVHEVGVLEPGAFADLVCLDSNLETADPMKIRDIKVIMTICGGKVVYDAR